MTLKRQIVGGTLSVSGAALLSRVGTFAANIAVIRALGVQRVGELGLIDVFLTLLATFSLFGVGYALTRSVAFFVDSDPHRAGESIGAGIVLIAGFSAVTVLVTLGLVIVANPLVPRVSREVLHPLLPYLVLLALCAAVRETQIAVLYGLQSFRPFVTVNLVVGLLTFPIIYFLALYQGVEGVVIGRLVLLSVEDGLLLRALRRSLDLRGIRVSFRALRSRCGGLFRFGLGYFIGQLPAAPTQTMLANLLAGQPGGLAQYGLYTTAGRLPALANFVPSSIAATFLPLLTSEWSHGDPERFRAATLTTLRIIVSATLPVVVLFAAGSPALVSTLYGQEFVSVWPTAFLLVLTTLLTAINEPLDRALVAAGKVWHSSANNYVGVVLFLGLGFLLIPPHRALGYGVAYVVSFTAYVAFQSWRLRKLFGIGLAPVAPLLAISMGAIFLAFGVAVALKRSAILQLGASVVAATAVTLIVFRFVLTSSERTRLLAALGRRLRRPAR